MLFGIERREFYNPFEEPQPIDSLATAQMLYGRSVVRLQYNTVLVDKRLLDGVLQRI